MIKTLTASFVLLFAQQAMAQQMCTDFHKFNCMRSTDKRFSLNGQSKSASVQVGKETELNIIVYRGQDYRITLCHDDKILGENLAIRLVEKIRVPRDGDAGALAQKEDITDEAGGQVGTSTRITVSKNSQDNRVYDEIEKVLWDNTEHDMVQEVEFTCTATKRIAIEVNAMGGDGSKLKKGQQDLDIGCVGILIEHMTSPPLGF